MSDAAMPFNLVENCGGHTPDGHTLVFSEASDHCVKVLPARLDNTSTHEVLRSVPHCVLPEAAETEAHSLEDETSACNLNSLAKLAEEAVKASVQLAWE